MKVVFAMALLGLGLSGCADLNKGLFDKAVLGTEPVPAVRKSTEVDVPAPEPAAARDASTDELAGMEQGSTESENPVANRKPPATRQKPAAKPKPQPKPQGQALPQPKTATKPKPVEKSAVESPRAALTKDQCMAKYPMKSGQLSRRQQCINALARDSAAKMNASQKAIVSDCSRKLLTLADSADKAAISLDAYNARKQQLRGECNTAIRKAGGATTKSSKIASSRQATAGKPASKTASPKPSNASSTTSAAKAR